MFGEGIVIGFVPMCHIYGVILNLRSIILDAPLIVLRKFEENNYLQLVQNYKVGNLSNS